MSTVSVKFEDTLAILNAIYTKGMGGMEPVSLDTLHAYRAQVHLVTKASMQTILADAESRDLLKGTRGGYVLTEYGRRTLHTNQRQTG